MRLPKLRTLILLPTVVCGALILRGDNRLNNRSNSDADKLVYVHTFLRHGSRVPTAILRDHKTEAKLWIPTIAKCYSDLRHNVNTNQIEVKSQIPMKDLYLWKNVSQKLNGCFLAHKRDNWDDKMRPEFTSLDRDANNEETASVLANIRTWDHSYKFSTRRRVPGAIWYGQLTTLGVSQLVAFGAWLRSRYIEEYSWLSPVYSHDNGHDNSGGCNNGRNSLYVHCTNFCRTIYSADAVLQGLYPLPNRSRSLTNKIPLHCDIHSTALYPSSRQNTRKIKANDEWLTANFDPLFEDVMGIRQTLMGEYGARALAERDDNKNTQKSPRMNWIDLMSSVVCRLYEDVDTPLPIDAPEIQDLIQFVTKRTLQKLGLDRQSLKYMSGLMLHKLMHKLKNGDGQLFLCSAHDTTLLLLLNAISNGKSFDFVWPNYAGSIIFEVWEKLMPSEERPDFVISVKDWMFNVDRRKKRYVRILFEKQVMHIGENGSEFIALDKLEDMWKDLIITD